MFPSAEMLVAKENMVKPIKPELPEPYKGFEPVEKVLIANAATQPIGFSEVAEPSGSIYSYFPWNTQTYSGTTQKLNEGH